MEIVNIKKEFINEDYDKDQFEIHISLEKVNFNFHRLFKYSEKIQKEYYPENLISDLSFKIIQLQQALNIKEENIICFFKLINEENVEISIDQYCDLVKIAKYFKVKTLQSYLSKYAKKNLTDIDFIINLLKENETNKTNDFFQEEANSFELEQLLIDQINECLNNERFGELPISMIYRIIKESSKTEINQNLLFDFINKNRKERYILFSFLNLHQLSESNFKELY